MPKLKAAITGQKVVDVGYRSFLLSVAVKNGMTGFFAENIRGREAVEVLVEGGAEGIAAFRKEVEKNYPDGTLVDRIAFTDYDGDVMGIGSYYQYFTASQTSKIAGIGRAMLAKQDAMLGKQDQMLAKQDEHIQLTKAGFESVVSELKGFRELHEEVRELRGEFSRLKESVARIAKKIKA